MTKKAVILLSGGLDSITVLAAATKQGYTCYALSFNYGQRHLAELKAAQKIASVFTVAEHKIIPIGLGAFGGSALTDFSLEVPHQPQEGIPITYVPARNTVFLSLALGWAEIIRASDIFIGVNAIDYSGYPDCRPEFIAAFQNLANIATKAGVEGQKCTIHTPLINLTKSQIIQTGLALGVDYSLAVSCYQANHDGKACSRCDSCRLRAEGFREAGVADPTRYQA